MTENKLSDEYLTFLEKDIDRCSFIVNYLSKRGVKSTVINLNGRKHIYLNFFSDQYNGTFRLKTLIAHYDRVPQSPGANDNSFAVFTMMNWAVSLNARPVQHNIRIIFTDGEEAVITDEAAVKDGKSIIEKQGAWLLGLSLKKNKTFPEDIYVFDCMGRGTIPVLAKAPALKKASDSFKKEFNKLYHRAEEILYKATKGAWVTLPVSWSDNAALTALSLPCVLITMLPKEEASFYMMNLAKNPELENFVVNHEINAGHSKSSLSSLLPESWLLLHSPNDNEMSITLESTLVFEQILNAIAEQKIPAC